MGLRPCRHGKLYDSCIIYSRTHALRVPLILHLARPPLSTRCRAGISVPTTPPIRRYGARARRGRGDRRRSNRCCRNNGRKNSRCGRDRWDRVCSIGRGAGTRDSGNSAGHNLLGCGFRGWIRRRAVAAAIARRI